MPHYHFEKTGELIHRPSAMPPPGPFFTTLVDMTTVDGFPFDFALYFSTDHHRGQGGIWLYVCKGPPSEPANWLSYDQAAARGAFDHLAGRPAANPIFIDAVQGTGHTETPHARVVEGTVYMSYHKNGLGPSQATLMAISEDGVNFRRLHGDADSVILSYDTTRDVGNGHTGYFRWGENRFPEINHRFTGYSLHGGGLDSRSALWASDDARQWRRLAILKPQEGLCVDHPDRMIIWHGIDPGSIRPLDSGQCAAICQVGTRSSGGRPRILELYEIYLGPDGATLTRDSRPLLRRGTAAAADAEELGAPTTVRVGNTYHLLYVGARDRASVNTIMGAAGGFDPAAAP